MIEANIKFENSKAFRRRVDKLIKRVSNTKPLMHKISIFLEQWVQENFKTEGGKYGGWKPLKLMGRWVGKGKSRRFDAGAKILQDSSDLRKSYRGFHTATNAGVGSKLPYAPSHEEGSKYLPRRKALPTDQLIMKDVLNKVNKHIDKALRP